MSKNDILDYFGFVVLFTAIAFISIGIFRQEHIEVFQKAINVCLECIGVG